MRTARKLVTILSGGVPLFPFSDSFDTDGALGSRWTGATWTISGGKAVNAPSHGAELISNPDFEAGIAGWTQGGTPTTFAQSAEQAHGGTNSLKIITDAGSESAISPNFTTTTNGWYEVSAWYRPTGGVNERIAQKTGATGAAGINQSKTCAANQWTKITLVYRETNGGALAGTTHYSTAAAQTFYLDDVSAKEITFPSCFASVETGRQNLTAQVAVTISAGDLAHAGLVLRLDSTTNPQNFLIAYTNGGQAVLDQCKAGVWSTLRTGAITYGAGKVIKAVLNGTTAQLFYDNVQVGADAAVDATITGTRYGLFSDSSLYNLDGFSLTA